MRENPYSNTGKNPEEYGHIYIFCAWNQNKCADVNINVKLTVQNHYFYVREVIGFL